MPSSLPKKMVKRKNGTKPAPSLPPTSAGRILEMKTSAAERPHGWMAGFTILVFLVIGCLAAAFLASERMKEAISVANSATSQLAASEKQNADLQEQLDNLKTLDNLARMIETPLIPQDIAWDTYSSSNISIQYPHGYEVIKATSSFPALTIKSDKGRIEIFRMKDFPDGVRASGCGGVTVSDEELLKTCPVETLTTGITYFNSNVFPYNVWIYYKADDIDAKAIFDGIAKSIEVKK